MRKKALSGNINTDYKSQNQMLTSKPVDHCQHKKEQLRTHCINSAGAIQLCKQLSRFRATRELQNGKLPQVPSTENLL